MPCNAVVTAAGKLAVSPAALLQGDASAHAAALAKLAPLARITGAWVVGRTGLAANQEFRLATSFGTVEINQAGEVFGPRANLAAVQAALNAYLPALARQKALLALRGLGRVTNEQALPGGGIVVSLEV